jgi:cell cycle arrest protein BUB2
MLSAHTLFLTLSDSHSPNQILRNLPGLNAQKIISVAMSFVCKIPEDMYAEIISHAK